MYFERLRRRVGPCLCLLLVIPFSMASAIAQTPAIQGDKKEALPEPPAPLENIEEDRAWVQHRLEAAAAELEEARLAQARQGGGHSEEQASFVGDLVTVQNFRVLGLRQHLELLAEVEVVRQDLQELRQEEDTFSGGAVDSPATYAVALEQWHAVAQFRDEEEADRLRTAIFAEGKEQTLKLLSGAGQEYRLALEKLEAAREEDARREARQNVEISRATQAFAKERLAYFGAREQAQSERAVRNQTRSRLLEGKLAQSLHGLKMSEADFTGRLDAVNKEIDQVQSLLTSLAEEETALQAALDQARAAAALASGNAEGQGAEVGQLRLLLDRAAALRATTDEITTLYLVWLNLEKTWWQRRKADESSVEHGSPQALDASFSNTLHAAEEARRLLDLTKSEVTRHLAELNAADIRNDPSVEALRSTLNRRVENLRRSGDAIQRVVDIVQIWRRECDLEHHESSIAERGKIWVGTVGETAKQLWDYELFAMEDRITVDGEVLVEKRPVTFGKAVLALIVLSVGLVVARWLGHLTGFLLAPLYRRGWGNRLILEKLLRAGTIVLAVVIALVTVKIPLAVFAFLGGALAIGIGFGAQNLINNFISGFILLTERPIRPGDIIELDGIRGKVANIGERCTRVRRFDGIEILIPNSQLLEQSVTNMTHSDHRMRASLPVGVASGASTRKVQDILLQIARDHELVLEEPVPQALFEGLGENALNFSLYFWVDLFAQPDWRVVASDLLHRICERFAEEKITIAFPQRDVHLDATMPIPVEMIRMPGRPLSTAEEDSLHP